MEKKSTAPKRDRRRLKALAGTIGVGAFIWVLIYFEQIEVIYVLSTLGLIILLLLVAFSDLEKVGVEEKIQNEKS